MPIYEYLCRKCGEFEVTQKITEPRLTRCPSCQSKVTKLMSSTSFQLKGTGWYATDYAGKSNSQPSRNESKSETKTEAKSAGTEKSGEGSTNKTKESAAAA